MMEWAAGLIGVGVSSTEHRLDLLQALEGALAALLGLLRAQRWGRWRRRRRGRWAGAQAHAADLKILLEPVGLEEVGEFEAADIAALGADFALEVENDDAQVRQRVASPQEFKPHALAVESQTQGLAG